MQEKAIIQYWILVRRYVEGIRQCSALVDGKWVSVLANGGGQKKMFQYCLDPNYPHRFLYLRNSRTFRKYFNLALQDNVLLPEGFTEYVYHVGNGKELRSIVNHGLIPGGVNLRTCRQAVFFTIVNLMDNQDGSGETLCDLSQARIASYKNILKHFQDTIFLVQFEARSTKRTAILSNKMKRSYTLRHTACRVH